MINTLSHIGVIPYQHFVHNKIRRRRRRRRRIRIRPALTTGCYPKGEKARWQQVRSFSDEFFAGARGIVLLHLCLNASISVASLSFRFS
jgi:hypothetical protein